MANLDNIEQLDHTDRNILKELQKNARISNQELADKVNLTPSPCLRRVKQLEKNGYILNYRTELNASKLGLNLIAVVMVGMDKHIPERFDHFESVVNGYEEVLECLLITGKSADYMLKVIVSDMQGYQRFLLKKLTPIAGVTTVESSFVLRQVINNSNLKL